MTLARLNAVDAQAVADAHEDALALAYERVLRAAGSRAAARFKRLSVFAVTAAADPGPDWAPPDIDELVDLELIAAETARRTAAIHERTLRQVLGAYGLVGEPSYDVTAPAALTLLGKIGGRSGDVAKSVRDDLQKTIGAAYEQGLSVVDAAKQILELSDQFSIAQARMLARTDLNGIANGGSLLAAKEVDVGFKTWLTASDDLVRPTHQDADGQTVPIDQPFDVGGEALDYPGDPGGSDEECCNCRCTLVYADSLGNETGEGEEDLQAAATIGGTMETAQITIPLTVTVGSGTATAVNSVSDVVVSTFTEFPGGKEVAEQIVAAIGQPRWRAVLCVEGEPTEDGRLLEPGSITWRDLPLTLLAQTETQPGHDGAEVCGRIDRIWREGNAVMAEGVFDQSECGMETARMVSDQVLRGVSVDLAVLEYEIRAPEGVAEEYEMYADPQDGLFVVTDGVIGAATICSFQAIANATIEVLASSGPLTLRLTRPLPGPDALTAAAAGLAPLKPPAAWFDDPALAGPTAIQVTDAGRIYGHAALWNTCHIGIPGSCTTAPKSRSGYRYFHLGAVTTEEGDAMPVGQVTLGTGHPSIRLGSDQAMEHYDNTGTCAGDVRVGEDAYGIWVSGAIRPELSAERVRDLAAAKLSGDWRNIGGQLELVGLLAVNVPGFPVPRVSARVASAGPEPERLALVAAGLVEDAPFDQVRARVLAARAHGGVAALAELAHA